MPQSADGGVRSELEPDEEAVPLVLEEDQFVRPLSAQSDLILVGNVNEGNLTSLIQVEESCEASKAYPAGEEHEVLPQQIIDESITIDNAPNSISGKESGTNSIAEETSSSMISNRGYVPPGRITVIVAATTEESAVAQSNQLIQDASGPPPTKAVGELELPGYIFSDNLRENKETAKRMMPMTISNDEAIVQTEGDNNDMTEIADGGMRGTREEHSFQLVYTTTSSSPANGLEQMPHLQSFVSGTFPDSEDVQDAGQVTIPDVSIKAGAPLESESLATDGDAHQDIHSVVASLQASQIGPGGSVDSNQHRIAGIASDPDMESSLIVGFDDEKMSLAEGDGLRDGNSMAQGLGMDSSLISSIAEGDYPIDGAFADFDAPNFPSKSPVLSSSRPVASTMAKLEQANVDSTQSPLSVTEQSMVPASASGHQERSISGRQLHSGVQSTATPADAYVNSMQGKLTERLSGTANDPTDVRNETMNALSNLSETDGKQVEQDIEMRNSLLVIEEQATLAHHLQSVRLTSGKEAQAVKRNEVLQKTIPMDLEDDKSNGGGSSGNSTISDTPGKKAVRFAMADYVTLIDSVNEKSTAPWGPPPGGFPHDSDHDSDSEAPIITLPKSSVPSAMESAVSASVPVVVAEAPGPTEPEKNDNSSSIEVSKPSAQPEKQDGNEFALTVKFVPAPLAQTQSSTEGLHPSYVYNAGDVNLLAEKVQVHEVLQPSQSFSAPSGASTATSSFALPDSESSSTSTTSSFAASSEVAATVAAAATGILGKLAKQKLRGYVLGAKSIDLGAGGKDSTEVEAHRLAAVAEAERLHRLREEHERKKLEAELAQKAKLEDERKRIEEEQQLEEERTNRYGKAKSLGFHSFKVGLSRQEYEKMKVNSIYIRPTSPLKPSSPTKPAELTPIMVSSPSNSSPSGKSPLARSLSNMSPASKRRPSRRVSILKTVLKPLHLVSQSNDSTGSGTSTPTHFQNSSNNNNNGSNSNDLDSKNALASSDMTVARDTLVLRPSSTKHSESLAPISATDNIVADIQADDLIDKRFGWQKDPSSNGILAATAVGKVERTVTSSSQLLHQLHNDGVLSGKANSYSSTHNDGPPAPHSKSFFAKSFRAMRSSSISMMQQSGNSENNSGGGVGTGDLNAVRNARAKRANAADFIPSFDDEYHPHSIFEHYSGFVFHDPHHEFYQRPWDADLFPERYHLGLHPPQQRLIHSAGGTMTNTADTGVNTTSPLLPSSQSAPNSPSPFSMSIPGFGASPSATGSHLMTGMSAHNLTQIGSAGMSSKPSSSGLGGGTSGGGGGGGGKRYLKAGYMINCYRPWGSERQEDELEEFVKRSLASASSCEDWDSDDGNFSQSDYSGSGMLSASSASVSVASTPLYLAPWAPHGLDNVPESVEMGDEGLFKLPQKSPNSTHRGNSQLPMSQGGNTGNGGDDMSLSSTSFAGDDDRHQRLARSAQRRSSSSVSSKQTRLRSRRQQVSEITAEDGSDAAAQRTYLPPISSPAAAQQREASKKPILLLEDMDDRKKKQKKRKSKSKSAKKDKDTKAGEYPGEPARQRLVINIIEALPGFVLPGSP